MTPLRDTRSGHGGYRRMQSSSSPHLLGARERPQTRVRSIGGVPDAASATRQQRRDDLLGVGGRVARNRHGVRTAAHDRVRVPGLREGNRVARVPAAASGTREHGAVRVAVGRDDGHLALHRAAADRPQDLQRASRQPRRDSLEHLGGRRNRGHHERPDAEPRVRRDASGSWTSRSWSCCSPTRSTSS